MLKLWCGSNVLHIYNIQHSLPIKSVSHPAAILPLFLPVCVVGKTGSSIRFMSVNVNCSHSTGC